MTDGGFGEIAKAAADATVPEDGPGYSRETWFIARDAALFALNEAGSPSASPLPPAEAEAIQLLRAFHAAEDARNDCPECENEGQWEHCSQCSERIGNAINDQLLFLARTPATSQSEEITLHEAAKDLLDAKDRNYRTVGFREDLWNCLRAILGEPA